jgi:hypothetical protein
MIERIVAALITLFIPGAGPPLTKIANFWGALDIKSSPFQSLYIIFDII